MKRYQLNKRLTYSADTGLKDIARSVKLIAYVQS